MTDRYPLRPDLLATADQLAAEVDHLAGMVREHIAGPCTITEAVCPGPEVFDRIVTTANANGLDHVFKLLVAAIVKLSKVEGGSTS